MQEEAEENIEKTYPCKECNSLFSFPLPLEMHIKNNHEGKLECDECNFRADTVKAIEDHEMNFHGTIDGEMPIWQKLEMNCKSKLINYLILVEENEGSGKDQRHFGHQNWRIQDNWKTVEQGRKDTMWRHIRQTWFIEEAQREEALHKR